jgi:hypothetical protein
LVLFYKYITKINKIKFSLIIQNYIDKMGIGDWGLGIGDWGLGGWAQTPNPQSPIPNPHFSYKL